MKKFITLLLSVLFLAGCALPAGQEVSYRQINMDEAITMMEEESSYIILDVRTQYTKRNHQHGGNTGTAG